VPIESNWERTVKQAGSVNRVQSGVCFRAYLGACNEVHLAACFQVCCMQRDV